MHDTDKYAVFHRYKWRPASFLPWPPTTSKGVRKCPGGAVPCLPPPPGSAHAAGHRPPGIPHSRRGPARRECRCGTPCSRADRPGMLPRMPLAFPTGTHMQLHALSHPPACSVRTGRSRLLLPLLPQQSQEGTLPPPLDPAACTATAAWGGAGPGMGGAAAAGARASHAEPPGCQQPRTRCSCRRVQEHRPQACASLAWVGGTPGSWGWP
jgi:hypothetical protein